MEQASHCEREDMEEEGVTEAGGVPADRKNLTKDGSEDVGRDDESTAMEVSDGTEELQDNQLLSDPVQEDMMEDVQNRNERDERQSEEGQGNTLSDVAPPLFFEGSIMEAIGLSKAHNKIFMVYLVRSSSSSSDDGKDSAEGSLNGTYDPPFNNRAVGVVRRSCCALRLVENSDHAKHFGAIYPVRVFPTIAVIGLQGSLLEWIEGDVSGDDLAIKLEQAEEVFSAQVNRLAASAAAIAAVLAARSVAGGISSSAATVAVSGEDASPSNYDPPPPPLRPPPAIPSSSRETCFAETTTSIPPSSLPCENAQRNLDSNAAEHVESRVNNSAAVELKSAIASSVSESSRPTGSETFEQQCVACVGGGGGEEGPHSTPWRNVDASASCETDRRKEEDETNDASRLSSPSFHEGDGASLGHGALEGIDTKGVEGGKGKELQRRIGKELNDCGLTLEGRGIVGTGLSDRDPKTAVVETTTREDSSLIKKVSKASSGAFAASQVPASAASHSPAVVIKKAQIQFRLIDGSSLKGEFDADDVLRSALDFLHKEKAETRRAFAMMIPFPRRVFGESDMGKTFRQLQLIPTATIILSPIAGKPSGAPPAVVSRGESDASAGGGTTSAEDGGAGLIGRVVWGVGGTVGRVFSYFNPFSYVGSGAQGGDLQGQEAVQKRDGWEYGPNPDIVRTVVRQGGDTDTHLAEAGARAQGESGGTLRHRSTNKGAANSSRDDGRGGQPSRAGGRGGGWGGNVHGLRRSEDTEDDMRDRNAYWNGNSTQYGGDADGRGGPQ